MGEVVKLSEWREAVQRPPRVSGTVRSPGIQSLAVTVTDLSPEGACIEAPSVALPSFFLLEIDDVERICRSVWRDERGLAVRFVNARTMGRSRRRRAVSPPEIVTPYPSTATQ